jgi:outer membrane receptor protein involved in Fe transport
MESDPAMNSYFYRENRQHIVTAAINAILTDYLGLYGRYKYVDNKITSAQFNGLTAPLVPMHTASAGLVLVFPQNVKAMLQFNYAAKQYGDDLNTYRMPEVMTTDFSATWEPLKKHVMLKLDLRNIFDKHYETEMYYPAAGRSVFLTLELRL